MPEGIVRLINKEQSKICLSPISIWELIVLIQKDKYQIDFSIEDFLSQSKQSLPFEELPVTSAIALQSRLLKLGHEDPADRFLFATAYVHQIPFVTCDQKLINLKKVKIISE